MLLLHYVADRVGGGARRVVLCVILFVFWRSSMTLLRVEIWEKGLMIF